MSRKKFTSEFKAKVAIEALKGHKTINELSIEFGVSGIPASFPTGTPHNPACGFPAPGCSTFVSHHSQ